MVVNPVKVNSFAYPFDRTTVGQFLNDVTILNLTQEQHGRLVTDTNAGLSWVRSMVVKMTGSFCSGFSVLLFL